MCSVVSCAFVSQDLPLEDQVNAYRVFESCTNFHNEMFDIKQGSENAWNSVEAQLTDIMNTFSDGRNVEKSRKDFETHWKTITHTILGLILIESAIIGGVAAVLNPEFSIPFFATLTVSDEAIANIRAAQAFGVLLGAVGGSAGTVGTDLMHGSDYLSKITAIVAKTGTTNHDLVMDTFDLNMVQMFSGDTGITGTDMADIVASGKYANTTGVTPCYGAGLRRLWMVSYISNVWNTESTYIVMSKALGSCEYDRRGYQDLRVCLKEHPEYVWYVYFKTRALEGQSHKAYIRGPPGHAQLKRYTGLDLTDVVRSSLRYVQHHGNSFAGDRSSKEAFENFYSIDEIRAGGAGHGLFNIPICYSPGGQAISSINYNENRNYPCMCSKFPDLGGQPKSEQKPRYTAHHLEKRIGRWNWNENHPETMFNFLNMTGLYQSEDWYDFCTDDGHRQGDHCQENCDINWAGWFPPGQYSRIVCPFHRCKSRGHEVVGCESPNDNGIDMNKHCD